MDVSRRRFLGLAVGGATLAACGGRAASMGGAGPLAADGTGTGATVTDASTVPVLPATPTATPVPVPERGRSSRALLPGTASETELVATWSGKPGPVLMVLGGVHGNEPGGWLAAQQIAEWEPAAGGLLVVPQANRIAASQFVRTTDELGDLNRLYPGNAASALPMERLAAAIVRAATEAGASVLIDLHESWAFYTERTQNGTAFLGQTLTTGIGPRNPALGRGIIERVNGGISVKRDLLVERDGAAFRRDPSLGAPGPDQANRSRSSLSLGGYVDGLTPILVEMGQQDQPVERRTELHLAVVKAAMELLGMA